MPLQFLSPTLIFSYQCLSVFIRGYRFQRKEESKGRCNKFPEVVRSIFPFKFVRITGTSPQNSQMIWRHAPQGGVSVSVSAATAMESNPRSPSETALKIATRSAQQVSPSVAFSTLQPEKILPDFARTAAPTRKFENGACAFSRACFAAAIKASYSLMGADCSAKKAVASDK